MIGALLAGMFAGYAIAVPVGVIAVLIIETGMMGGLRRGLAAGAGAATVDLLFCSLALVVGGLLNQLLAVALMPLQLLSGGILISIGVRGLLSLRASSTSADAATDPRVRGSARQLYLRFIALTAMNPATILYFLALAIGLPGLGSDPVNAVARTRGLRVVEDACQAWLAEYKGRKCGTLGELGCFSFQQSTHIPAGEGGAITGMDGDLVDRCDSYHNCGRSVGNFKGSGFFTRGSNFRLTQFQGVVLLQQVDKLVAETARRREAAAYLNERLARIPGITPVRVPENSRGVYHLYPVRYEATGFNGLSRDVFLKALNAEGIPGDCPWEKDIEDAHAIAKTLGIELRVIDLIDAYREVMRMQV